MLSKPDRLYSVRFSSICVFFGMLCTCISFNRPRAQSKRNRSPGERRAAGMLRPPMCLGVTLITLTTRRCNVYNCILLCLSPALGSLLRVDLHFHHIVVSNGGVHHPKSGFHFLTLCYFVVCCVVRSFITIL
jgi:hypothetical protein